MRKRRVKSAKSLPAACSSTAAVAAASTGNSGDDRQWKFKVVFLGNSGVGKTSLVEGILVSPSSRPYPAPQPHLQLHQQHPAAGDSGTIGVAVSLSRVDRLPEGHTALLQLWDTSGKKKYRNLVRSYMPGTQCVVLVYEPAGGQLASRQALTRWHAFARETAAEALVAVVAVSSRRDSAGGGGGGSRDEGVNFGRVFASSLCGCFLHHQTAGWGGRRGREGQQLAPRWLAEQLIRRQQARSQAVTQLIADHQELQPLVLAPARLTLEADEAAAAASDGCFWCQRLLCSRSARLVGVCGTSRLD